MSITISYTQQTGGSTAYSVTFEHFTEDNLPRSYIDEISFDFTTAGSAVKGGPARVPKRIWAITGVLSDADTQELESMYRAWATDIGTGLSCAVSISDSTFGSTVTASSVISTAPTYSKFGPNDWTASIGLTEI